jgi:hypothetical protein
MHTHARTSLSLSRALSLSLARARALSLSLARSPPISGTSIILMSLVDYRLYSRYLLSAAVGIRIRERLRACVCVCEYVCE